MTLSMRRLALTASASVLAIGGVLLPGASAMAATAPDASATAAAPVSQSTAGTAAPSQFGTEYCELYWDGSWACWYW
jgi:hypothetical protein